MKKILIKEISDENFHDWLTMAFALWPEHDRQGVEDHFRKSLAEDKYQTYLAQDGGTKEYIGFINLSLRSDYVEGTDSSPVGYIESIFIKTDYRRHGVGKMLVEKGEAWAKSRGCTEFASDTEVKNVRSQYFHKSVGFKRADTIVHFVKKLT